MDSVRSPSCGTFPGRRRPRVRARGRHRPRARRLPAGRDGARAGARGERPDRRRLQRTAHASEPGLGCRAPSRRHLPGRVGGAAEPGAAAGRAGVPAVQCRPLRRLHRDPRVRLRGIRAGRGGRRRPGAAAAVGRGRALRRVARRPLPARARAARRLHRAGGRLRHHGGRHAVGCPARPCLPRGRGAVGRHHAHPARPGLPAATARADAGGAHGREQRVRHHRGGRGAPGPAGGDGAPRGGRARRGVGARRAGVDPRRRPRDERGTPPR